MSFNLLAELVKRYLLPGSMPFLMIALTLLLFWWYLDGEQGRRLRAALGGLLLTYWLLATPVVSDALAAALARGYEPLSEPVAADAIVVLGGGAANYRAEAGEISSLSSSSALRALEGVRLYRLLEPQWVVVSGGPGRRSPLPESLPLQAALVDNGVDPERILLESGSSDTHDQAVLIRPLFEAKDIDRFVLVTSPSHMLRADLAFREAGLEGIPSPARRESLDQDDVGEPGWLPSEGALERSTTSLREVLALAYYWLRGWI